MRTMASFFPTEVLSWQRHAQAGSRLAAGHRRRRREAALTTRARRYTGGRGDEATGCAPRIVALAADHELPGDARGLVGECDCGEFRLLAADEVSQPGRGVAALFAHLLDHRGGANHQGSAQGLVARPRDRAEAL